MTTTLTPEQESVRREIDEYAGNLIAEMSELARQRAIVMAVNQNRDAIGRTVMRELCTYLTRMASRSYWLAMARAYDKHARSLTLPNALACLRRNEGSVPVPFPRELRRPLQAAGIVFRSDAPEQALVTLIRQHFDGRYKVLLPGIDSEVMRVRNKLIAHRDAVSGLEILMSNTVLEAEAALAFFCGVRPRRGPSPQFVDRGTDLS